MEQHSFSSPGKVFLLGEYAVLDGSEAILAAIGPRFELLEVDDSDSETFAGESPMGLLCRFARRLGANEFSWKFSDPHAGAGGFGASTAQFILAYRSLARQVGWDLSWRSCLDLVPKIMCSKYQSSERCRSCYSMAGGSKTD